MIYYIKEKFWTWGDEFKIINMHGTPQFLVKGKVFSWGDQLSFQDEEGFELAFIKQKLLSLMPTYEIIINGHAYATLKKEFSWFKKKFTVDIPGPNDYVIEGSFWDHEFCFYRFGKQVAHISKKLWKLTDTYAVEIPDDEDHVSILCACIIIDQIIFDK